MEGQQFQVSFDTKCQCGVFSFLHLSHYVSTSRAIDVSLPVRYTQSLAILEILHGRMEIKR